MMRDPTCSRASGPIPTAVRAVGILPSILSLFLLPACSSGGDGPPGGAVRDTLPDGTPVVRYATLPLEDAFEITADLRIGELEGDPHLLFGDVKSIDATSDGTILVLDGQASEIRAFDAEGRYVRTVASRGEGPGEITETNGMILEADSVLWVHDYGKWSMLALRPQGGEITRVPVPVRSYGYVWSGTVDDAGVFWKETSHTDEPETYPPPEGLVEGAARVYLKSYDPATEGSDSLFVGESGYRTYVSRNARGGYSYRGVPFDARPISIVDPGGGFWRTEAAAYRVARLNESGDTTLILEAAVEPPAVTDEDRRGYVEAVAESSPEARLAGEEVAKLMPPSKPVIAKLIFDDQGRLWIERTVADGEAPVYDVFDREGERRAAVRLAFRPTQYVPIRIRHGNVYALVRDSLDVPTVVRAPLPEALRGGGP